MQFLIFNRSGPPQVKIGKGTRFAYGGIGCVIHQDCVIGENCVIGQGVTLGGNGKEAGVPHLESGVYVSAGARILGPVSVGINSKVGANAVVLCNIPPHATAVGIPARIVAKE